MVAELESDLIRLRTRKGIKVAKARAECGLAGQTEAPR
jgi:DNA invertase Pin-like site-specific DNA recombinase